MENIILKNIKKDYNGNPVIKGIDLTISKGAFVSIMGESGSGKSTLLHMMSSVLEPSDGQIFYDDVDLYALEESKRAKLRCNEIGIVYQFFNLVPTLKVEDNIMLPLYLRKDSIKQYKEKICELINYLKIEDIVAKYPYEISGGQQQRVAIARALIYNPSFLFLDEPTGNLDSENTLQVMDLLKDIVKTKGITCVQVTHSFETSKYGDRVVTIKDGLIIKDETVL